MRERSIERHTTCRPTACWVGESYSFRARPVRYYCYGETEREEEAEEEEAEEAKRRSHGEGRRAALREEGK